MSAFMMTEDTFCKYVLKVGLATSQRDAEVEFGGLLVIGLYKQDPLGCKSVKSTELYEFLSHILRQSFSNVVVELLVM